MVRKIVWTKRANKKFNSIIRFLEEEWGDQVTGNFVKQTYSLLDILLEQPELGTIEVKDKNIRGFLITKHNRIFYRLANEELVVLNFFDTRQHPTKKKY